MKLLSIIFSLSLFSQLCTADESKPNIIFLLSDDQSVNSMGCYGNKEVLTPNMDKLGADGIIFDKHYCTTAICQASRANIVTGMYEYRNGHNFRKDELAANIWEQSYPILIKEHGYLTAFAGKFGMSLKDRGKGEKNGEKDFDMYGGARGQTSFKTSENPSMAKYADKYPHSTLSYAAFSKDVMIRAIAENKPFCLSISFKAPHIPLIPDPIFDHIYAGKTFSNPANFGRRHGQHLSEQSKQGRQFDNFRDSNNYNASLIKYHQLIYGIDVALGMIREELRNLDIADNTVIIYTSDNGWLHGAHGYHGKVLPFEEASRVPLIIYDPRSKTSGKKFRSRALTANIDFAPTILALAGGDIPDVMDGKSLLPLMEDPSKDIREQLALMNTFGEAATQVLSVVTKDHKYSYWWYEGEGMTPVVDLFNTSEDPLELKNLAKNPEYSAILDDMEKRYLVELSLVKKNSIGKHKPYGSLFDPSIAMSEKQELTRMIHSIAKVSK